MFLSNEVEVVARVKVDVSFMTFFFFDSKWVNLERYDIYLSAFILFNTPLSVGARSQTAVHLKHITVISV